MRYYVEVRIALQKKYSPPVLPSAGDVLSVGDTLYVYATESIFEKTKEYLAHGILS